MPTVGTLAVDAFTLEDNTRHLQTTVVAATTADLKVKVLDCSKDICSCEVATVNSTGISYAIAVSENG